jgi:hypothetical protein
MRADRGAAEHRGSPSTRSPLRSASPAIQLFDLEGRIQHVDQGIPAENPEKTPEPTFLGQFQAMIL